MRVKIIGAGSAGNHLAHGCRQRFWDVLMVDSDSAALSRTKDQLYPSRYGKWDAAIRLANDQDSSERFDFVAICTPPHTHLQLAMQELSRAHPPRTLLIEKPLASPDDPLLSRFLELSSRAKTKILVGYNHNLTPNTQKLIELLESGAIGEALELSVEFREHVDYILKAHWWFAGIGDSYLGSSQQGGGAAGEHSHAVALWNFLSVSLGKGPVTRLCAQQDRAGSSAGSYDLSTTMLVRSSGGLRGRIQTDFQSRPALKRAELQGTTGRLVWWVNFEPGVDSVELIREDGRELFRFPKTRPDDFRPQLDAVEALLKGEGDARGNSLEGGLQAIKVVCAAHRSAESGREVTVEN